MAKQIPAWIVMAENGVRCQRCGRVEPMPQPMPADAFQPWTEYVGAVHRACKDTGRVDPTPASVHEWWTGHDTGTSSKAIYRHMMGYTRERSTWGTHPHDPDDFGRCYRLLNLAPEWRARISEMAEYSKAWAGLAGAWDELTMMYESALVSGTNRAEAMYLRMKELATAIPSDCPPAGEAR